MIRLYESDIAKIKALVSRAWTAAFVVTRFHPNEPSKVAKAIRDLTKELEVVEKLFDSDWATPRRRGQEVSRKDIEDTIRLLTTGLSLPSGVWQIMAAKQRLDEMLGRFDERSDAHEGCPST